MIADTLRTLQHTMSEMARDVLTFLVNTLPRWRREWKYQQGTDHKLAERLRRREYEHQ
jgi:hypothetical protein